MARHHHHREPRELGRTVRTRASMEVAQAAAHLETLAKALRSGGITIRSGAGVVALRTGDRIDLELEAGEEGRHTLVRWALRWETPVPEEELEIVPGVQQPAGPEPGGAGARARSPSPSANPPPPATPSDAKR
jgi:amphi-Trp domain-containing protein